MSIAWCAGLFDGEGCFSIRSQGISYDITASIQMTHEETIRTFHKIIEYGRVSFRLSTNSKWKNLYRWQAFSSNAAKVASLLLPHLITKKEQAERLIEFNTVWKRRPTGIHYTEMPESEASLLRVIMSEMKDLNRKGPN